MADGAVFDTVQKALAFALNYQGANMPRPAMTKAMAEAPAKKPSKKAAKARRDALAKLGVEEREKTAHRSFMGVRLPIGQEAAYLAGIILRHFDDLEANQQLFIISALAKPRFPCACRSPCCSGWRVNPRWLAATTAIIELLKVGADVVNADPSKPGRGLSTQPGLRRALVEEYFLNVEHTATELSVAHGVARDTVTKHRTWIWTYLDALAEASWLAADRLFDETALLGFGDVLPLGD